MLVYNCIYTYIVAPQIIPFDFGDEAINAEDMTSLQCTVSKGDLPLDIVWTHNSYPISLEQGIIVSRTSKRISTLSIDDVQAGHAGHYVCSATNKAGTVTHAAILNVNGDLFFPPLSCFSFTFSFSFYVYFVLLQLTQYIKQISDTCSQHILLIVLLARFLV